jgi:hypothetical protein
MYYFIIPNQNREILNSMIRFAAQYGVTSG